MLNSKDIFPIYPDKVVEVKQETIGKLVRGDHIVVKGTAVSSLGYLHHGIYLGRDKGVADMSGESKLTSKVQIRDLSSFTDDFRRKLYRIDYAYYPCLAYEEAARRAEEIAREPARWSHYNIFENNCEHFATWCKIGEKRSNQVVFCVLLVISVSILLKIVFVLMDLVLLVYVNERVFLFFDS